jgi:hypothetical protein
MPANKTDMPDTPRLRVIASEYGKAFRDFVTSALSPKTRMGELLWGISWRTANKARLIEAGWPEHRNIHEFDHTWYERNKGQ